MTSRELRRRTRHYPVGWKVAVEVPDEEGKQVIQTEIRDLSATGAAIRAGYRELTGSIVKLSITWPGAPDEKKPLRIRARVVSSSRTAGMSQYRHGLSFIRLPFDGRKELERMLQALPVAAKRDGPVSPIAEAGDRAAARRGRLAELRRLADAKRAEVKPPDRRDEVDASLSEALRIAYDYLKDLTEQLNVIKPAYRNVYVLPGLPEFPSLAWEEGKADFHMREVTPVLKRHDRVSLRFRLAGPKEIQVTREYPASEKLKQFLEEAGILYASNDMYNERGAVAGSKFIVPCEAKASLVLTNELALGKVLLRASNVAGFGALSHLLAPESIDDESLDELTAFILGETKGLGARLLRNA